jgi:hypothetical protein
MRRSLNLAYQKEVAMLRSSESLYGDSILATDGPIGSVDDFYFDDNKWTVRYLVADIGSFLEDRRVLISPEAIDVTDDRSEAVTLDLSKQRIQESPELEEILEVGSRSEAELRDYYGWPYYWAGWLTPGGSSAYWPAPSEVPSQGPVGATTQTVVTERPRDPNLRSTKKVSGYKIEANDGAIGHVDHFIFDDETWDVRYLVVKTRDFLPGKSVLISPEWVSDIDWDGSRVHIDLTRDQIKDAPEYDPSAPLDREYEERLHGYYGRPGYWF